MDSRGGNNDVELSKRLFGCIEEPPHLHRLGYIGLNGYGLAPTCRDAAHDLIAITNCRKNCRARTCRDQRTMLSALRRSV